MSTKKSNRSASTSLTTVKRSDAQPLDIESLAPTVKFNLEIGYSDIVGVLVSEQRELLQIEIHSAEAAYNEAVKQHSKLEKMLTDQAQRMIDEQAADRETRELVERINTFTSVKHAVKIVRTGASTYYGRQNRDNETPEINVAKLKVIGEIRIENGKDSVVLSRGIEILFNDAMKETVSQIEKAAVVVGKAAERLQDAQRRMADVLNPNGLKARVHSQLIRAQLSGHVTDTQQLLAVVLGTPVKSLPSQVVNACRVTDVD